MEKRKYLPTVVGVILVILIVVIGTLTPLVGILNPVTGVIGNSRNLEIGNESFNLPGLQNEVKVIQDKYGIYHIYASSSGDLYYALGFIQAKERLFQIEVFGLEGMGRMQSFFGNSYQNFDRFQTLTGAPITAQNNWNTVLSGSATNATDALTSSALISYADGVNAYINYSESHNTLPLLFKLLGVSPYYWTPVYSFAVEEIMIQQLEFSDNGLQFSTIYHLLGNDTYDLIPTFSTVQTYYYAGFSGRPNPQVLNESMNTYQANSSILALASNLMKCFQYDPPTYFNLSAPDHSNEIVLAGNRTTTGDPILMGGPVLGFSLPSIWFQVQLVAPGIDAYGVVLPGEPAIVIGFNQNIAWTLTDTQSISDGTFFFAQNIENGKYLWNSTYNPLIQYHINGMTVNWTNLGPVMQQSGNNALVMDWLGNMFSNDLGSLLNLMVAQNWSQFVSALSIWQAPFQNFAFANRSMIADISPAYYPVFGGHLYNPGAIMPGNGSEYISGKIPYNMVPQVVNPKDGFIVSSNQRQVGPSYPYWFGNTLSFSSGYRANMEVNFIEDNQKISVQKLIGFQSRNYTDEEAQAAVPIMLHDIAGSTNSSVQEAYSLLSTWNYNMSDSSKAASVWFFSYMYLFNEVFLPYLKAVGWLPEYNETLGTPSGMSGSFANTTGYASMDIDMLHFILENSAAPFNNTNMSSLITKAITKAMQFLDDRYPSGNFTWGQFHGFEFPNLFGLTPFSVGPIAKGGDFNTPNDAPGIAPNNYPESGQSWVMVVNLSNMSRSYGVYPGGQSENPESPQYSNYIDDWIKGNYLPLLYYSEFSQFPNSDVIAVLTLHPGGKT